MKLESHARHRFVQTDREKSMIGLIIGMSIIFLVIVFIITYIVPIISTRAATMTQKSQAQFAVKYDAVLSEDQIKKSQRMILYVPVFIVLLAIFFAPADLKIPAIVGGIVAGVVLPRMHLSYLISKRKTKFANQLMDALMIMSSSFRGGLSLIQAIESVVEEMPDPLRQEFGIVLGENKMGVALDDSLNRLYKRMPSPSMQQVVTAILLARETGGNLALIFSRIIASTRERRKVEQSLTTLTIQGKIQGVVMTGLPVLFYLAVSSSNPHFFDVMRNSPLGQKLTIACFVLWILGALSIWKISKFKDI